VICSSSPERTGRDGFLSLRFEQREGKTVLSQSRFRLPLQVLTPVHLDDHTACVMLLNPTGGVLGGDRLLTEVVQEQGTQVCLTTPSATRVYRSASEPAVQETLIHLGAGATLEYLPDHVIPHAGARFHQSLRVDMGPGCRAIVLDAMASGRVAHGEQWRFAEFDSRISISIHDKPAYVNRTRIVPDLYPPQRLGFAEEFDYLACVIVLADGFAAWTKVASQLREAVAGIPEVLAGVSLLTANGCVARILAHSAPAMNQATTELCALARELILGRPRFELRKY
jgi:urease accessory protein